MTFGATFQFAPAAGGRGSEVDIAAPAIAVIGTGPAAPDSYLTFSPQDIAALNASSVLLGATRTDDNGTEQLDVRAENILIQTDAAHPLVNPELILAGNDNVRIAPGSVIAAQGNVTGLPSSAIAVGRKDATGAAGPLPDLPGDAAILRVSNGNATEVIRSNVQNAAGSIVIGAGAAIDGGKALNIDSTQIASIDATASLGGNAIDIASQSVNFLGQGTGANIGPQSLTLLGTAQSVSVRGSRNIQFAGPLKIGGQSGTRLDNLTLDTPLLVGIALDGGAVALDANHVVLTNNYGEPGIAAAAAGSLNITAGQLVLTGGDRALSGFNTVTAAATTEILAGDGERAGTLTLPGAGSITLTTPLLAAAGGSDQTIATGAPGMIAIAAPAGGTTAEAADQFGGRLALDSGTIIVGTMLSAVSGTVDLRARSGALTIASGGEIFAGGFSQSFIDTDVALPGGNVRLTADQGDIVIASGARVSVAGSGTGDAGAIALTIGSRTGTAKNSWRAGWNGSCECSGGKLLPQQQRLGRSCFAGAGIGAKRLHRNHRYRKRRGRSRAWQRSHRAQRHHCSRWRARCGGRHDDRRVRRGRRTHRAFRRHGVSTGAGDAAGCAGARSCRTRRASDHRRGHRR